MENEIKIRDQRQPNYAAMVKFAETIDEINKKGLIKMTDKLIGQLEEYKKNKSEFPIESDGIYILLEGAITVKNEFNPSDPDGIKGEPPVELYPPLSNTGRIQ